MDETTDHNRYVTV